jgi:hypothetical protein
LRAQNVKVVVAKEEKLGLTRARLKAFRLAVNSWFLLLDDDNALALDTRECLRKRLDSHPELGGICPQIVPRWEYPPAPWVVALGHQVLSYNTTPLFQPPWQFAIWKPGIIGARPPGGGMMVHRRAAEEFMKLAQSVSMIENLGRKGSQLSGGEDFVIYDFLYQMGLPTAYDNAIVIYHQISSQRMKYQYLLRLFYDCNFIFGVMAIMRYGKWNILYAGLRGTARLLYESLRLSSSVFSWRIFFAFACALLGYWLGVCYSFFDRNGVYLPAKNTKLAPLC